MEQNFFQPLGNSWFFFPKWITLHPILIDFSIFLIYFLSSFLIPGILLTISVGIMLGIGTLPFWETIICAVIGSTAGYSFPYWLGYHFRTNLYNFWPFRNCPERLKRGEYFFKRHGGKSIILGRLIIYPVRSVIPIIAGIMHMNPRPFFFYNILSSIVWIILHTLPGTLIGISFNLFSIETLKRASFILFIIFIVLWLFYLLFQKFCSWVNNINRKWSITLLISGALVFCIGTSAYLSLFYTREHSIFGRQPSTARLLIVNNWWQEGQEINPLFNIQYSMAWNIKQH